MSEPPPGRKTAALVMGALMSRLADVEIRRPWASLLLVFGMSAFFAWRATHLELRTRYDQLLPDSQPSVVELRRVEKRVSNAQTAMIVLEGDDVVLRRELGDAIVSKLQGLGPSVVSSAADGVQGAAKFLRPRAGLFLDKADLEKLKSDVDARWDWEVSQTVGSTLDDEGAPPPLNREQFEMRFRHKFEAGVGAERMDPDTGGYYERKGGKALVIVAGSPAPAGECGCCNGAKSKGIALVDRGRARR